MCHISNIDQTSCLKLDVRITGFGHFSIEGKCGVIMEINTIYWESFYFVFYDGAIIVLQNTGGMVPFCICGEFQLQSCTFSTCHRLSPPLHISFLLKNTTGGFCFGGFVVEIEHIFWEQHEYMQSQIFFFFVPSVHFWKEFLRFYWYCNFKGCFPVCVQHAGIVV